MNVGNKFAQKGNFMLKTENDHHLWFLHIQVNLDTKFQLKLAILFFGNKFAQKGYFQSKIEKVNYTNWVLHIQVSLDAKFQLKGCVQHFC